MLVEWAEVNGPTSAWRGPHGPCDPEIHRTLVALQVLVTWGPWVAPLQMRRGTRTASEGVVGEAVCHLAPALTDLVDRVGVASQGVQGP